MIHQILQPLIRQTVEARALRARLGWWVWAAIFTGTALLLGALMLLGGPNPALLAWIIYLGGAAAILYRPRYGIYLTVFFALVGDPLIWYYYPFNKNFSSSESLFYLNDALVFSPLETYLALTAISWLARGFAQRKIQFYSGTLVRPMLVFLGFVIFGFAYGAYRGGDMVVALWELRPIIYLAAMLILSTNLFERREHAINLMYFAVAAVFIEGLAGSLIYFVDLNRSLEGINQITEHAVAIHMNSVIIFAGALWLYKTPLRKRAFVLATLPFMMVTYLATQRRSAFLSLMIAFAILLLILYLDHRRLFWWIVPAMALAFVLYVGIFWNIDGGMISLPVDAIKSVITPEQASAGDQSSNYYRMAENYNLSYTIHQNPLTGVGFGRKFEVVWSMADISFFTWWQYLPHNSVLWVWLKTGVFGFIAFLYFVGLALAQSAQALRRLPKTEISAVLLAGTLYLLMHFIYAYFDISWDARSMVYIGSILGMVNSITRIMANTTSPEPKRWPWLPDPLPEPGLAPLSASTPESAEAPGKVRY